MKTGVVSVKLALAGFIVPYMFVYNQQLMLDNVTLFTGIQVVITACAGVFLIAVAAEGFLFTKVSWHVRGAAFVAAIYDDSTAALSPMSLAWACLQRFWPTSILRVRSSALPLRLEKAFSEKYLER